MKCFLKVLFFLILSCLIYTPKIALAITNPTNVQNNKFGIHIISPTDDEVSPAAILVNSSGGDWGYVTILIESRNRDKDKWQSFFDDLRRRHLIPIVRLATEPEKDYWKKPYEKEEQAWADFLDSLNWPVKNRYVAIYNEPNQGQEWGGQIDPESYAKVLDKTITALKNKNPDFFVLNAGFDASAPDKPPLYLDEQSFLTQMEAAVPGILGRLDGWVSHSYPNPGFNSSPDDSGQGSVRTWAWEIQILKNLGVNKNLPVFITETGWKHAEGINYDKSLPSSDIISDYYQNAFENAWNNYQIVAVTPFLLNYQEPPFDHFSFKKITGEKQNIKILGVSKNIAEENNSQYYSHYNFILNLPKIKGQPMQDNKAQLIKGELYSTLVAGENYKIYLTFKNTGESIWNEESKFSLKAVKGADNLQINIISEDSDKKIEPGQNATFDINFKAPESGSYTISFQLFSGKKEFDQAPLVFTTNIKSSVELFIEAALKWKKDYSGDYILTISSEAINTSTGVKIDKEGKLNRIEAKYLLPDYTFDFTLHKPFYKPKTIKVNVREGDNLLDFGELDPDFFSVLFKPSDFWNLTPFSN